MLLCILYAERSEITERFGDGDMKECSASCNGGNQGRFIEGRLRVKQ
jgi:hypothetical protein